MRVELTGRHIKITPALRALVDDGLAHSLRKLNSSALSVQVVLTKEKSRLHAEATLHVKGDRFLHADATGRDPQVALAAVLERLDHQAQKVKNKWADGKRRNGRAVPEPVEALPAEDGVRIIKARRYAVKPMSVDEAAMEVGASPNAFVVFRDASSEAIGILFRRQDGNLGLIEPEL
jgi:putative sigma-54 modulation protein